MLPNRLRAFSDFLVAGLTIGLMLFVAIFYGSTESDPQNSRPKLRIGYMPNLTHAVPLLGFADGTFQSTFPEFQVSGKLFSSGPEVMEALLAGELDIAYVGPTPAINAIMRGRPTEIVACAAQGGASLVAGGDSGIREVADLDHKRVAVPQLGNTQDVALRIFLSKAGLAPLEKGGTVQIIPIKPADVEGLLSSHQIDAAWLPEPWPTRIVTGGKGIRVLDERDLWPNGVFATTVLVVSKTFSRKNPDILQALLKANKELCDRVSRSSKDRELANQALTKASGKALSAKVLEESWKRLSFRSELDMEQMRTLEKALVSAGYGVKK